MAVMITRIGHGLELNCYAVWDNYSELGAQIIKKQTRKTSRTKCEPYGIAALEFIRYHNAILCHHRVAPLLHGHTSVLDSIWVIIT